MLEVTCQFCGREFSEEDRDPLKQIYKDHLLMNHRYELSENLKNANGRCMFCSRPVSSDISDCIHVTCGGDLSSWRAGYLASLMIKVR